MPGFGQFLDDVLLKSRAGSVDSTASQDPTPPNARYEAVLFPAGFGVAAGERFDDVASIPRGLAIQRIKQIKLYHGAWLDSIETTYILSDDSEFVCSTGRRSARSSTYEFAPNEILLAMGGLLGFIRDTDILVDDLMIDYLQFHIKDLDTGEVRIVPENPESFGSSQGADFFVQGPILAFSGRHAGYVSQIQPYLAKDRDADFGQPAPGVAFDDRKTVSRHDRLKRIKQVTIWSGAWIEGIEVAYETKLGKTAVSTHGGVGGTGTVIDLDDDEVIEAICVCNSGPFPFCDALRFYIARYDDQGVISRRTVPDKSSPALGYEYEFGENSWIRSGGRGSTIFAFAGVCGSYIEELACWVRHSATGEERLVRPTPATSAASAPSPLAGDHARLRGSSVERTSPKLAGSHSKRLDEHRRSFTITDAYPMSNSLNVPTGLSDYFFSGPPSGTGSSSVGSGDATPGPITASPELVLPTNSCPSSPSLPISLGRFSISSIDSHHSHLHQHGEQSPGLPRAAALDPHKKKRLSAQLALLHGEDVTKQGRRLSVTGTGTLAPTPA